MARTLADIFGANATLDDSTPSDPKLVISLQNFQNSGSGTGEITDGGGLDDASLINSSNADSYASKILSSIIKMHLEKQPADDDDETDGSFVSTNFGKAFLFRNSIEQLRRTISLYLWEDAPSSGLDPDNVK